VPGLTGVVEVAGSVDPGFYCARLRDGTVKCWGEGGGGALGDGNLAVHRVTVPGPAVVGLSGVVRLAAAPSPSATVGPSGHACAVLSSGKVMCWGANGHQALGSSGPDSAVPVEAVSSAFAGFSDVCTGRSFACALERTGFPVCSADNQSGLLGRGTTSMGGEHSGPYVMGDGAYKALSCGGRTACGIKGDGSLWCWGVVTDPDAPLLVPTKLEPSGVEQVALGDEQSAGGLLSQDRGPGRLLGRQHCGHAR
jgi:alpha-tubulin suppressor-like RCC1 family protein